MCVFSTHDLLRDPPFPEVDLISCRNLLIYLDTPVQPKVIRLFHHALRSGGVLFLGTAESIAGRPDLFETVERGQRIFRRRDLMTPSPLEFPLMGSPAGDRPGTVQPIMAPGSLEVTLRRSVERAVLDEYTPAGMVVREDGDIVYVFGPTAKYLGPSAGAPTLNALALLRKSLRTGLRRALQKAVRTNERVVVESSLATSPGDRTEPVNLIVRPFTEAPAGRGLFVVVFQDVAVHGTETPAAPTRRTATSKACLRARRWRRSSSTTTCSSSGSRRPPRVLLDLGLPGTDGYEVARQLRQNPALAGVTLVAVTGYGAEEDRQRSREAGIDHHPLKPVDMTAMQALIHGT